MPNLSRLIYVSEASKSFKDAELALLVERMRRENEQAGVTGLLIHAAGQFVHVLEGELEDVASRYDVIRADRRHKNARRISFEFTSERMFPSWWMGFLNVNQDADARVRFVEIARLARALPGTEINRDILALLGEFKSQLLRVPTVNLQRAAG
jgi:hypothetical protein